MVGYLNSIGIQVDPSQFDAIPEAVSAAADDVSAETDRMVEEGSFTTETTQESNQETNTDKVELTNAVPHVNPNGAI
jgi:hypothetical protein